MSKRMTLLAILVTGVALVLAGLLAYESDTDRGKRAGLLHAGISEDEVLRQVGPPTRTHRVGLKARPDDECSPYPLAVRGLEYDVPSDGIGARFRRIVGASAHGMNVVCLSADGKVLGTI